jgi:hypothetical protein
MSGSKATGAGKARRGKARVIQVSPLARAVHLAFAASLALAGSGVAVAGTCTSPVSSSVECTGVATDNDVGQAVSDPTSVFGPEDVPTSVTSAFGTNAIVSGSTGHVSSADIASVSAPAAAAFSVDIVNSGPITKSGSGDVIGIDADFAGADISITNRATGVIDVESVDGLADGIFAGGDSVTVKNQGAIEADGFSWAAGIEAQGYDLTTVTNNGDISATATANDETDQIYGSAFGIYATGGDGGVKVNNKGTITADGVFATGVLAQGGGPVTVSNTGDITVGGSAALTSYYSTGIEASSNYENGAVTVNNRGTIAATGDFGAKGISALATGEGSIASVINSGAISAFSAGSDYSNGTGILASGDAGATVRNTVDGTIFASGNGYAYGVQALTFNGDANVVNNGDVTASADGDAKYSAYALGVLASSLNGTATVSNTGNISANAASQGSAASRGIYAIGVAADVVNSGDITTFGGSSLGIGAVGSTGDVTVLNQGSIHATANKYSSGTGIAGTSTYGDVSLTNGSDGEIVALGNLGASGMQARSFYGNVNLVNAGSIEVGSSDPSGSNQPRAVGMYAASRTGDVSVVNSGTIQVETSANPFGIYAFTTGDGITTVDNSGTIQTISEDVTVWGVYTGGQGGGGDIAVHNSGTIEASTSLFAATGIWSCAGSYDYYAGGCTATGDVSVVNDGTITAFSGDPVDDPDDPSDDPWIYALRGSRASGIRAYGDYIEVASTGSITADGFASASGIDANGISQTLVTNSGDISVSATANDATKRIYGQAFGIKASGDAGGVGVINSGGIDATAPFTAIGIYAASADGDSSVYNDGAVSATSTHGLADGIFASGVNVDVTTGATSSITADGFSWAAGIEAQSDDLTTVTNRGDINAVATANDEDAQVYGHAFGIYATGGAGGVGVTNRGAITADGVYADGAFARGYGPIAITNIGDITVGGNPALTTYFANGIQASNNYENSSIVVNNRGTIAATGYLGANGLVVSASGVGSSASVDNRGDIHATGTGYYAVANGVVITADGDASFRNSGAITVDAGAYGIYAYGGQVLAFAGDANVANSGDVQVTSSIATAYGFIAASQNGETGVTNSASITVDSLYATGIAASSLVGTHVTNTGDIGVNAFEGGFGKYSLGINARSSGDTVVDNRGSIEISGKYSRGINAIATAGDVTVRNQGSIYALGIKAYGLVGISTEGDVRITNTAGGVVDVQSGGTGIGLAGISTHDDVEIVNNGSVIARGGNAGLSAGVYASSGNNDVSVVNRGSIEARTRYDAIGVLADIGSDDELSVDNRGSITATSASIYADYVAVGIDGTSEGGGAVVLRNRGTIVASNGAGDAVGINGIVSGGDLTLANTVGGSITATSIDSDAVGMQGTLTDADVSVTNAGNISASSVNGTSYAIRLLDGEGSRAPANATITNSGTIHGAIVTGAGNDTLSNLRGGTWEVRGDASDFGAGNDSFSNAAGARLVLSDAGISFGAGNNRFTNAGTIHVSGNNTIDMTDGSAGAVAAALTRPKGTASFTNNGIIDFLDGAADDSLTITGGFGGNGAINLDVSLDNKRNDRLFVQGGVLNGTKQVVNVALLDGLPKSSDVGTTLDLVHVSGDTNPSVFVGGDVLGISSRDFLSMGLKLSSKPDKGVNAGDGSAYMLSVKTYVKGLSSSGVLASSAALGVDSLMTSGAGSWRDRQYALQAMGGKPAFASITPWVRGFNDEGGMSPDHLMANFGQMSSSRLSQDNSGTEVGMEFQGTHGLRFGTMFGKSEATQSLVNEYGRNTIRGNTMGLYATWLGQNGLYVDTSWRTMKFEAAIGSGGLYQRNNGNAYSANIEAGYAWTLDNGLNIEPKLQYTSTTIDGMQVQGDEATFRSEQARWNRGQAGFSFSKRYGGGSGWRLTPYGELSMLRTFDGVASYSINQDYFGDVMTEGTSALVKLGLGAQKGRFSWSGGVNWMDGAAYDSVFGGQMTVGYAW